MRMLVLPILVPLSTAAMLMLAPARPAPRGHRGASYPPPASFRNLGFARSPSNVGSTRSHAGVSVYGTASSLSRASIASSSRPVAARIRAPRSGLERVDRLVHGAADLF